MCLEGSCRPPPWPPQARLGSKVPACRAEAVPPSVHTLRPSSLLLERGSQAEQGGPADQSPELVLQPPRSRSTVFQMLPSLRFSKPELPLPVPWGRGPWHKLAL